MKDGSKGEKRKFQDVSKSEFSWHIDNSNNYVMYYVYRKEDPDIAVTGKKFKCESLVYQNKTKSLKHEKCFNVVSEKNHSSTKYLLPHSEH
jgi:tRNA splicing endonuclease